MCKIVAIELACTFSGEVFLDWMVSTQTTTLIYNDSPARPDTSGPVRNLSPYTDYKCCVATVLNSDETSAETCFESKTLEDGG